MMKTYEDFSPWWFDQKWRAVRWLSDILQPHRDTTGWRHRLTTSLYLKLLLQSEYADPALIRELQLLRLKKVLERADTTPWWHEYFSNAGLDPHSFVNLTNLQKLPPVNKQILRTIPHEQLLTRGTRKENLEFRRTSGTTATPFEWATSKNDLFVEDTSYVYRMLYWYNALPTHRKKNRAIIGSFVAPNFCTPAKQLSWDPTAKAATEQFLTIFKKIKDEGLSILFFYSTHLILFTKKLGETQITYPFKLVITGGQELDDTHRNYVEEKFKCSVALLYGATELEHLAVECPSNKNQYHLNAERMLLEITDEKGSLLPEGEEGLITFTSLQNTHMPLIRYQLGDWGTILSGQCSCGKTLPRFELRGKKADFIKLQNGKQLLFQTINVIILKEFFLAIDFYQIEQVSLQKLVVRLKLKETTDKKTFEDHLLPKIQGYVGEDLHIIFEYPANWHMTEVRKIKTIIPLPEI